MPQCILLMQEALTAESLSCNTVLWFSKTLIRAVLPGSEYKQTLLPLNAFIFTGKYSKVWTLKPKTVPLTNMEVLSKRDSHTKDITRNYYDVISAIDTSRLSNKIKIDR